MANLSLHTCFALFTIVCMILSCVVAGRGATLGAAHVFILRTPMGLYNDGFNKPLVFKLTSFLSYPAAIDYGFVLLDKYTRLGKYR